MQAIFSFISLPALVAGSVALLVAQIGRAHV